MKSIEERADRAIYEPTDGHPLRACEVVAFARGYELGATEQKAIDDEATLKGFTTDELRAELKRRTAEEKAKKGPILRCRMCKHWGVINCWGKTIKFFGRDLPCKFSKTKNGYCQASRPACEHFERKEE